MPEFEYAPAKGVQATLIHDFSFERIVLRVYKRSKEYRREEYQKKQAGADYDKEAWSFKDYAIQHYDLDIIIDDVAGLYQFPDGHLAIDYPDWEYEKPERPEPIGYDLEALHRLCNDNHDALEHAILCGCFYCQRIFPVSEINRWHSSGATAICPHCSVDSILADTNVTLEPEMLRQMYNRWFS